MNHTDKAKLDAARRMLTGKIPLEEVAMLLEISVEQLVPLQEEIEKKFRETYGDVDAYDIQKGTVILDDFDDWGEDADIPEGQTEDL